MQRITTKDLKRSASSPCLSQPQKERGFIALCPGVGVTVKQVDSEEESRRRAAAPNDERCERIRAEV